jgi:hypothetical protein
MKPSSKISKHDLLDTVDAKLGELRIQKETINNIKTKIQIFEEKFHM